MSKVFPLSVLLIISFVQLLSAEPYQVVFETVDCDGGKGFATVGVETIYKIIDADCTHPDNPDQHLKQLLVNDASGSYTTYTLSHEEARDIMTQVKGYMKAKRGLLERSDAVIVNP